MCSLGEKRLGERRGGKRAEDFGLLTAASILEAILDVTT